MDLEDLNKVWEVKPLKKVGEDEARRILEKVAKQVQPIMRKRKWRVKILSEFSPANPSLLGLNEGGGAQIKLRLRKPNRDWDFFPYEHLLDTMLHELCHIEHGPHNADFYKLWDEIRKECEELITKGITGTGQGFDVPGRRLGGFSRQPPLSSLRQTALAAAEKRARIGAILPSGPKCLGGDSDIMVALSPIQAAAMAAERRLQDDLWCGSKSYAGSSEVESNTVMLEQFPPKESAESSKDSIAVKTDSSNVIPQNKGSTSTSTSGSTVNHCTTDNSEDQAIWECKMCTLLNPLVVPRSPKMLEPSSRFGHVDFVPWRTV
eukprot:TRINITY_DN12942_c1_g1_i1.p1 TRINITY_DN12942_c1_g1~~TRINITY_DN12942_c1_g1_i1.p1  ORF type:complete len:320 (+),score=57.96 TRINITY_DN12942_c1_g1_i1:153-1112(+)